MITDLVFDGNIEIAENLGWLKFKLGINVNGALIIEASDGIEVGQGMRLTGESFAYEKELEQHSFHVLG